MRTITKWTIDTITKMIDGSNTKDVYSNGSTVIEKDGQNISLRLHGSTIAKYENGIFISNKGYTTNVTKDRLNAFLDAFSVRAGVVQRNYTHYLIEHKYENNKLVENRIAPVNYDWLKVEY